MSETTPDAPLTKVGGAIETARAGARMLWFPVKLSWSLIKAYKHATWDQAKQAAGHIRDSRVSPLPKAVLGVGLAVELLLALKLWLVLHVLLPFLLASPIEELIMVPLLSVILWLFNLWSERSIESAEKTELQRRLRRR